jgi:Bacterial PH domain
MNVKDILSQGEELLFKSQQCRWMPGGKEITPSEIFVTNQRIIIETSTMLGLHKDFQDLHYSDVEGIELKKGILSSTLIIKSRFKGDVHINAIPKKQAGNVEQIINEGINRYGYGRGSK